MKGFRQAYEKIPLGKIIEVQSTIMHCNGWDSRQMFWNKKEGHRRCNATEANNIKAIFARHGINAETGEPIQSITHSLI